MSVEKSSKGQRKNQTEEKMLCKVGLVFVRCPPVWRSTANFGLVVKKNRREKGWILGLVLSMYSKLGVGPMFRFVSHA